MAKKTAVDVAATVISVDPVQETGNGSTDQPETHNRITTIVPTDQPEAGVEIPKAEKRDPFDLSKIRNRQRKERRVKVVTSYRVARKPRKGAFFQVNPDADYSIESLLYVEKDENNMESDTYLIDWDFAEEVVASEHYTFFQPVELYVPVEKMPGAKPFVLYVPRPREGDKDNNWWLAARTIAEEAMKAWIQPYNSGAGYDFHPLQKPASDPEWPETSFGEILRVAFKDRFIDSWDHEVMKALMGV